jgi:UPF0042 nucleotide-binding protein
MAQKPVVEQQTQPAAPAPFPVLIITGLSGSGKSTVLRALEDVGYFCVDNLPLDLLPAFLHMQPPPGQDRRKIALVMDVRTQGFLQNYAQVVARLKQEGYQLHLIFLEAGEAALLRRFSQTRRAHPLADRESTAQALEEERRTLAGLREMAHRIIDSSQYNPHQLRELIKAEYSDVTLRERMWVHIISFAYKNGIPPEADVVLDVRCLPNPFFVEGLSQLTGNDPRVRDYVLNQAETRDYLKHLFSFFDFLLPLYQKEGKSQLTVALGCTGGQHRSVVMANILGEHLAQEHLPHTLSHRDLPKTPGD